MKRFHTKITPFRVTLNHAFGQVIEGCAEDRLEGTWITRDIILSPTTSFMSWALRHSDRSVGAGTTSSGACTAWRRGTLFCGESMDSPRSTNASKNRAAGFFSQEFALDVADKANGLSGAE